MRKHPITCLCASCLSKKGLSAGKNNGNYKDGRTTKKHKCKEGGCENLITFNSKYYGDGRCRSCSKKGKSRTFTDKHKYNMSISRLKSDNKNIRKPEGSTYKDKYIKEKVNGKWVPQHRIVVENYIGRKLKKGEVVHHINEDKCDNNPKNLYVFEKRGLHTSFTLLVKYKIISLENISSNLDIIRDKGKYVE